MENSYANTSVSTFGGFCRKCNTFKTFNNKGPSDFKPDIPLYENCPTVFGQCSSCDFKSTFIFRLNRFTAVSKSTGYCENCGQFWTWDKKPTCGCECCIGVDECTHVPSCDDDEEVEKPKE
jgi:hypothetical protein